MSVQKHANVASNHSNMLLLVLLATSCCHSALGVAPACPIPAEVPLAQYPPNIKKGAALQFSNDGGFDYFQCPSSLYVGQRGAGTDTFTIGSKYKCDPASGKWMTGEYEAPPVFNCAEFDGSPRKFSFCGIIDQQKGNVNAWGSVALYQGKEQYCAKGQSVRFADGKLIRKLECDGSVLHITLANEKTEEYTRGAPPTLTCVPALTCPLLPPIPESEYPSGFDPLSLTTPGNEFINGDYRCANSTALVRLDADGPVIAMQYPWFRCQNGIWSVDDSSRIPIQLSCVKAPVDFDRRCELSYLISEGRALILPLHPDYKYCPAGEKSFLRDGTPFSSISCEYIDQERVFNVKLINGTTIIKSPLARGLEVTCVAACDILNQKPDGAREPITVTPGKEQFCPAGEIVQYADGTPIKDIKCSGAGLEIETEDGTISKPTNPTLKCVPGTCRQVCSTPPLPAYCPPNGVWSEWTVAGQCATTCGSYNTAARKRTCTDKCGKNCPCIGPSEDVGNCGIALCPFPAKTCGAAFVKSFNSETSTLFCGTEPVPKTVCPLDTTTTSTTTSTTTTTTTTTTTVKPDSAPTSAQLWDVMYYYNYARILHAFCADQACINVIQANGIGYDLVNYKGLVGRAIREDAITAVRAACPTGSANLRNLGFTRVGNHYEHNLSGSGLKQGWVAIVNGACGATKPIKRWKCHQSEDMQYETNLEGNTFYAGLVQDGGKVQFWMF